MILYLMRHGVAVDREDPECPPDPKRYLTPKGVKKTREVALGLRALKISPEAYLSSPYVRAVQTAEIVADALGYPRARIRHTEALLPPARPAELLKLLAREKSESVICFGHAPNLDEVIAALTGNRAPITALKKAGVACLEFDSPTEGQVVLQWIYPPKVLRLLAESAK